MRPRQTTLPVWVLDPSAATGWVFSSKRVCGPTTRPTEGWKSVKEPFPLKEDGRRQRDCSVAILMENYHTVPGDRGCGERALTSFRWSVLPQDADRLCMQKLARSPSGSCQDRGVCRKTCSKTDSSVGRKQPGGFLDRGGGL